jgi:small-conductance mechanosensitive channel
VIRLWDWRRLIVPLSHFIEKPFQNWTRESAAIIGTVLIHADYTVPVERVRQKLSEIVKDSPHCDGNVVNLQVTDANERTIELRALVSAKTSPQVWDLRCHVREMLIAFLQRECPAALPKVRAEVGTEPNFQSAGGLAPATN